MDKDCYGMHLTLRIKNVEKSALLNEKNVIHEFLVRLVTDINMRILAGPLVAEECSNEGKSGCSGLILLYESHAAIHTYVDLKEAFIDIFSCKEFNVECVQKTISDFFGPNLEQALKEWTQTRMTEQVAAPIPS
jgi:S-adenosylmethionine decarboxylase